MIIFIGFIIWMILSISLYFLLVFTEVKTTTAFKDDIDDNGAMYAVFSMLIIPALFIIIVDWIVYLQDIMIDKILKNKK